MGRQAASNSCSHGTEKIKECRECALYCKYLGSTYLMSKVKCEIENVSMTDSPALLVKRVNLVYIREKN
jgi:hypothetical protein